MFLLSHTESSVTKALFQPIFGNCHDFPHLFSANEKPIVSSVSPNTQTLRGNSSLTITGSKFLDNEGGATVTIGGVACANVVVVSDTSIQCYAPAMGVGPQPVMVTIPDKGYSVNSPAVPVTYAAVVGGELLSLSHNKFPPSLPLFPQ